MIEIHCTNCHRPYPEEETPHICQVCGGLYDYTEWPDFDLRRVDRKLPGIWRYRHALGLEEAAPEVSLGEGSTPLVWTKVGGKPMACKLEFLNPTGSFKDRGSAALASFLKARGVTRAIEDSSGNAGASFAAYAAATGIRAQIFVPDSASGPKRMQIEAYGAEIVRIMGPRSNSAEAARRVVQPGAAYASHATLPQVIPGYATAAYELWEQIGNAPGAVIVPAGQGNFLLGLSRGFEGLKKAGLIDRFPTLIGVQALACSPLWALHTYGPSGLGWVMERETIAEGVRVRHPRRGDAVLDAISQHNGGFIAVPEEAILAGRDQLARLGFYVEPTSALVWNAFEQLRDELPEPIILMLTGSGLKTS